jgi:hypothetical protein
MNIRVPRLGLIPEVHHEVMHACKLMISNSASVSVAHSFVSLFLTLGSCSMLSRTLTLVDCPKSGPCSLGPLNRRFCRFTSVQQCNKEMFADSSADRILTPG